ncbi:MAG: S41 family peptidase [Dehalococcoidia bacterium]|nr:S41 family peptidase [Dehalococcoidia bacterium]
MNKNILNNILIVIISILIAVLLVSIGFISRIYFVEDNINNIDLNEIHKSIMNADVSDNDLKILAEIYEVLDNYYVEPDKINQEELFNASLLAILRTLDDIHTNYIDPETFNYAQSELQGTFQGIGANISEKDGYVIIVTPFENSPAIKAGIRAGDKILTVDGESAQGWSTTKAALTIRGPEGTSVIIKVEHLDGSTEEITVIRAKIQTPSVSFINTLSRSESIFDRNGNEVNDIAYIKIGQFTESTPDEIKKAIKNRTTNDTIGIIFDVRGNPGGLLDETLEIADMFLDEGIITIQVDRDLKEDVTKASNGTITDLPIIILQDPYSASGSELFASALQGNQRATVMGEVSFGKGTVNTVKQLSNGGALYVSTARYLSPTRQVIEKVGVIPDIESKLTMDDVTKGIDTVIIDAVEYLKSYIQ